MKLESKPYQYPRPYLFSNNGYWTINAIILWIIKKFVETSKKEVHLH